MGDFIAQITAMLGILPGLGCGCDARRKRLNQWFPRFAVKNELYQRTIL